MIATSKRVAFIIPVVISNVVRVAADNSSHVGVSDKKSAAPLLISSRSHMTRISCCISRRSANTIRATSPLKLRSTSPPKLRQPLYRLRQLVRHPRLPCPSTTPRRWPLSVPSAACRWSFAPSRKASTKANNSMAASTIRAAVR
jgi:hypothetical protein